MLRFPTPLLCAGLAALTVAAFLPVWNNEFIDYDDPPYITQNPYVLDGLTGAGADWALTGFDGKYWQPLSWLSLQLDAQLFSTTGPDGGSMVSARAVHVENLCWHVGSVLLLFAVVWQLTGARWRALLVAALFAVHPMRVESVAWAAERKDVLSVFFGLLALWAYAWYVKKPMWERFLVVAGAYACSLCCKPTLITLPFVLLLLDYWPLGRTAAARGRLVLEKLPLFALAAAVGALTVRMRHEAGAAVSLEVLPLADRVANALTGYGWYVAHSVWPTGLAVLYPHPVHDWSWWGVVAGSAILLLVTALALWQARRRPWLLVGWLWFVGTLLPVSGLSQGGPQAWADRFTYWPHIGLLLAVVWTLAELAQRLRIPAPVAASAATLAVGCLALLTWVQVGYWRDPVTLWERDLAVTRDNYRAEFHLGMGYRDLDRLDLAAVHLAEAARLQPHSYNCQFNLGVTLLALGRYAEAIGAFEEAVQQKPRDIDPWYKLGLAHLCGGRPAAALPCFRKVLEFQPGSPEALAALGDALWDDGQPREAVQAIQDALKNSPDETFADSMRERLRLYRQQKPAVVGGP